MDLISSYQSSDIMVTEWLRQYVEMQTAIKTAMLKGEREESFETCFEIICDYLETLNKILKGHVFSTVDDEIYFFKKVKPLFYAEREYYVFRYHIVLFRSAVNCADSLESEQYYRRQLTRMNRFSKQYPELYEHIKNNDESKDRFWFTRSHHLNDRSLYEKEMGTYLSILKLNDYIQDLLRKKKD